MKNVICLLLISVSGCGRVAPDTKMVDHQSPSITRSEQSRISVDRIGVFEDSLAYSGKRGIYLFRDAVTGKEWIGVSGVGISELGEHQVGKNNRAEHEE